MKKLCCLLCLLFLMLTPAFGQFTRMAPRAPLGPTPVLYAPVPAVVEISYDYFVIRWDYPGTGHGGFEITASSDGWSTVHFNLVVGPTRESAVVSGLNTSTTYDWRVRTLPPGAPGSQPCTPTTCTPGTPVALPFGLPPQAPTGLQVAPGGIGATTVVLIWPDTSTVETAYRVARLDPGEDPDEFVDWDNVSGALPPNTTTFAAENLLPSTTYRFKVRSQDALGYSPYSNIVTVTTAGFPARPTNLQVADYDANTVLLTWQDNAVDETDYRVAMLPPGGDPDNPANWNNVGGGQPANSTSYLVAGLTASSDYRFKVRARNATVLPPAGPLYSDYSNVVSQRTGPRTPTGLVASAVGLDYVTLAWVDHASTESAYRVSILPPGADPNKPAAWNNTGGDLPANTTSHTVSGLVSGATYSFRVRAKDDSIDPPVFSAYSNVLTLTLPVPLATPTGLTVTGVGPDWIQLAWQDNAVGESYYRVARLDPGEDPNNDAQWDSVSGNLPPNTNSFLATGLQPNATYRFKVRCTNVDVTPTLYSNYSNIANGTTVCPLPAAPSGLARSALTETCITLTWTDNANNESAYRVAMLPPGGDPNNPANWNNISGDLPANTTQFIYTGLTAGSTYSFKVRAQNACGNGNYSNIVTSTAQNLGPPAPTNCVANRNGAPQTPAIEPIYVNWTYGTAQVDGFRVSRLDPGEDPNNPAAWDNYGGDLPPTARQYINSTNLVNGQTYTYKVRAFRITPCGRIYSDYSNTDQAIP